MRSGILPSLETAQKGVVMKDMEKVFEQIGKEIAEMKEATIAREVAKKIGELLRDNGVVVKITECTCDDVTETSFSRKYGAVISGLDFTEHDKPFLEKIKKLENEIENFENEKCETCYKENLHMIAQAQVDGYKNSLYMAEKNYDRLHHENEELKQRIAELESKETVELPFDALETANYLINATYKVELDGLAKAMAGTDKIRRDIYSIDELEQIAEHLLVYCKHNKEQENS